MKPTAAGAFWIIYIICVIVVIAWMVFTIRAAHAGGDIWELPQGGDCYLFSDTPTNAAQKRVMTEKGWKRMSKVRRAELGVKAREGKVEVLLVADDSICGDPITGKEAVYKEWYYRNVRN